MSRKPAQQPGRSRVSCIVDNSLLGALVQILADHRVSGIRVEPVDDRPVLEVGVISEGRKFDNMFTVGYGDKQEKKKKKRDVTPASQTRLGALIMAILRASKEPMTSVQVGAEIEKHSYKSQSASPCLSDLEKEKAVLCDRSIRQRYLYSMPQT